MNQTRGAKSWKRRHSRHSRVFHVSSCTFRRYAWRVSKQKQIPIALTIAGSDSGGGAGIQADLKTFAALGVHGASAITCITAQNPKRVFGIRACKPEIVRQQIEAVFAELPPAAVKTGMLYSAEITRVVAAFFEMDKRPPLVVDPVMISTSGRKLMEPQAKKMLTERLLPLATLVTPNLDEVEALLERKPTTADEMRAAAREIHRRFGCAVLVKGGHLRTSAAAVDVFFDGATEMDVAALFVTRVRTHGTGCTYAAAITANLALGHSLPVAVQLAKKHTTEAIAQHQIAAGHPVLNNFWRRDDWQK